MVSIFYEMKKLYELDELRYLELRSYISTSVPVAFHIQPRHDNRTCSFIDTRVVEDHRQTPGDEDQDPRTGEIGRIRALVKRSK
jgi:hypothetical protein